MSEVNLVIDSAGGSLGTGRKFVEIAENSDSHGIQFVYLGENELSSDVVQYSFRQSGQNGEIILTDDYENDLEYLTISNMSQSDTDSLVTIFTSNFKIKSLNEIKQLLTEDLEKNRKYLIHLGLMESQNPSDQNTVDIIRAALLSEDSETVLSGIRTLQLIDIPSLQDEVKALLETSADPQVRRSAALALAQMRLPSSAAVKSGG